MMNSTKESLPVVILCGGKGTRMRGDTDEHKVLVEVGGKPILWHIMRTFSHYGHNKFILTLGFMPDPIKKFFLNYDKLYRDFKITVGDGGKASLEFKSTVGHEPWEVTMVDTGLDTKKGTRIAKVAKHIDTDRFFVSYGDDVCNIDLDKLLSFHKKHKKLATITSVQVDLQYGIVNATRGGRVKGFIEKPPLDHWINGGYMIFEKEVLKLLKQGRKVDLEKRVLVDLAKDKELYIYRHKGFWQSMNTMKETIMLEKMWQSGKAPWKVWNG